MCFGRLSRPAIVHRRRPIMSPWLSVPDIVVQIAILSEFQDEASRDVLIDSILP